MAYFVKGFFLALVLSFSNLSFSQDNCDKEPVKSNPPKKDPIEYLHNTVLNPAAQKKMNAVDPTKNPEQLNLYKSSITSMVVSKNQISPDAISNGKVIRTETTQSTPKKEESSIGASVSDWLKSKYADLLNTLPSQISNVMLYRFIEDWMGTRYRMGGTGRSGIDCSAFVQKLYEYVFGMNLLRTAGMQFQSATLIRDINDLKEGDLVFFRIKSSRITHVGVYLRNNYFVHSASSKGVSIANLTNAYWSRYFAGGGRVAD